MSHRCATLLAILAVSFLAFPAKAAKQEQPKLLPSDGLSKDDENEALRTCALEAWESVGYGLSSPSESALARMGKRSSRGFLNFDGWRGKNANPGVEATPFVYLEGDREHPGGSGKAWSGESRKKNISDRYVLCLLAMGFRWVDDPTPPPSPSPSFEAAASAPGPPPSHDPLVIEGVEACHAGDQAKALSLFVAAAEKGDAAGQFLAGATMLFVQEKNSSVPAGLAWLRKAADQGHAGASYALAVLSESGVGGKPDPVEAARRDMAAGLRGHAGSQSRLGWAYRYGAGVPIDYVEAVGWQRLAAGQGYSHGLENLGYHYVRGLGVKKDRTEACRLFGLAAERGSVECQCRFAECLSRTGDVSRDRVQSLAWLEVLSKLPPFDPERDTWVAQSRSSVASSLSPEQIQEAATRAEEIRSRLAAIPPPDTCVDPTAHKLGMGS